MNILVVAPHPDDEAIGCGGTICKHIAEGYTVNVIFLTSGEKGGHGKSEEETILIREEEAKNAAAILGIQHIEFWKQPDGSCKANKHNVERMMKKLKTFKPSFIFVTHDNEQHPDHKAAAQIIKKSVPLSTLKKKPVVYMYEVWTPLSSMDHIVDISDYVEAKKWAILAHRSQCDVLKFHESALALNRYRGEMHSWPGGDYAEVFKLMKL